MRTSASRSRASRSCSRARSRSSCWATNWERVGREPSGNAFNSLVQLESERGKPRNPFINAGALVVTDVLCRRFVKAETALVEFVRRLIGANDIDYDSRVAQSELQRGAQPRDGALHGELRQHADATRHGDRRVLPPVRDHDELRRARALFLANGGVAPVTGERIVDSSSAKRRR